jgi:hypothetical protein
MFKGADKNDVHSAIPAAKSTKLAGQRPRWYFVAIGGFREIRFGRHGSGAWPLESFATRLGSAWTASGMSLTRVAAGNATATKR